MPVHVATGARQEPTARPRRVARRPERASGASSSSATGRHVRPRHSRSCCGTGSVGCKSGRAEAPQPFWSMKYLILNGPDPSGRPGVRFSGTCHRSRHRGSADMHAHALGATACAGSGCTERHYAAPAIRRIPAAGADWSGQPEWPSRSAAGPGCPCGVASQPDVRPTWPGRGRGCVLSPGSAWPSDNPDVRDMPPTAGPIGGTSRGCGLRISCAVAITVAPCAGLRRRWGAVPSPAAAADRSGYRRVWRGSHPGWTGHRNGRAA